MRHDKKKKLTRVQFEKIIGKGGWIKKPDSPFRMSQNAYTWATMENGVPVKKCKYGLRVYTAKSWYALLGLIGAGEKNRTFKIPLDKFNLMV